MFTGKATQFGGDFAPRLKKSFGVLPVWTQPPDALGEFGERVMVVHAALRSRNKSAPSVTMAARSSATYCQSGAHPSQSHPPGFSMATISLADPHAAHKISTDCGPNFRL
ncbi:MAG: hypothetical protein B7Z57_14330 [Acidiphilium sp. 37-60-79]|nr:MAG: hypothetical protein B7Z57_14330 [Acidiphilium sp. 37-60-79]